MAIFSSIAAAYAAFAAWYATLNVFVAALIKMAIGLVVSKIVQSLTNKSSGRQQGRQFGVSGQLERGADVPQSCIVGTYATAGSLLWGDEWGGSNEYLTLAIELSNLPVRGLHSILIDGERVTIHDEDPHADYGKRLGSNTSESKDYDGFAWIKFYDGNQTAVDPWLLSEFADPDSSAYAIDKDFIGHGNAYVLITYKVNHDGLWGSFPKALFVVDGIELLNAGTGRKSTTHNNPVDFIYTLMRGLKYGNQWFYGSQKIKSAQLDKTNWGAQRQKCIDASYTMGGEIYIDGEVADVITEALSVCNGKMAESGGRFRILAVQPDTPVMTFTDEDIVTTSEQTFTPFMGLSDAVNGISVVYPSPEDGWVNQTAPPLIRPDLETEDDNRRMMSDVELPFATNDEQVQRVMRTSLDEARRARKHNFTLPSNFWKVEPLDTISWTSTRNGYIDKQFIVDGIVDNADGGITLDLTEVDPSDYNWNSATDFTAINRTPPASPIPAPQSVGGWSAISEYLTNRGGHAINLGIRINWDGDVEGVERVAYQIRFSNTEEVIFEGTTFDVESGSRLLTKDFRINTAYEVRAKYIPTTTRKTLWTEWTVVESDTSQAPTVVITDFLSQQGETMVPMLKVVVSSDNSFYNKAQIRMKLYESGEQFSTAGIGRLGEFIIPIARIGRGSFIVGVSLVGADGQVGIERGFVHNLRNNYGAPAGVSSLSIDSHGETATLSWELIDDINLSHYKIKHSGKTTGARWSDASLLLEKVPRPATSVEVPSMTGTYFIKAFSKNGVASSSFSTTILLEGIGLTRGYNVVELLKQHDEFVGTKTNLCVNGEFSLQLEGKYNFDSVFLDFDSNRGFFDDNLDGVYTSGTYEFGPVDLGSEFMSRVTAKMKMSRFNIRQSYPTQSSGLDEDVSVKIEMATSNDGVSYTPWKKLTVGTFSFRFAKFLVTLKSDKKNITPSVHHLSIEIDMPDRIDAADDIIFTGVKDITFATPFKKTPIVGVTIENPADGDRMRIYNKATTGFSVEMLTGDQTSTNEVTMTYIAKGYGQP